MQVVPVYDPWHSVPQSRRVSEVPLKASARLLLIDRLLASMLNILKRTLFWLCFPCLCCYVTPSIVRDEVKLHKSSPEQVEKRRKANAPVPLPLLRRRLTLPLPPDDSPGKERQRARQTKNQDQSILFARLPLELRIIVYEFALGGGMLHVVQKRKRLAHFECREADPSSSHHHYNCRVAVGANGLYRGRKAGLGLDRSNADKTALLRTCRRVYSESIDILYSKNTFNFRRVDELIYISQTILPQRYNTIRSAQLTRTVPVSARVMDPKDASFSRNDQGVWEQACRILGRMEALEDLKVTIWKEDGMWYSYLEPPLLEPLRKLKVSGHFVVELPWPTLPSSKPETEDAPFQICRTGIQATN